MTSTPRLTSARLRVLAWLADGAVHCSSERDAPSESAIRSAVQANLCTTQHVPLGGGAYDLRVKRTALGRAVHVGGPL